MKVDADASPQPTPEAVTECYAKIIIKKDFSQVTSSITVPSVLNDPSFFTDSIAQKTEKSTPSAKKSHNIDTEAAEQAAREAAEVEAFRNAQDAEYDRVCQAELEDDITTAAERAIFDAEVSRSEVSAKDNNSHWFAWPDVSREVGNIVKEYGIKGTSARYISFAVHRAFNGFRAEVTTAEYCKSFIEHACFPYTYDTHPSICI